MGAGKHKIHRKNRISKHVLEAQERRKNEARSAEDVSEDGGRVATDTSLIPSNDTMKTTMNNQSESKMKKLKKNRNVKDPAEAEAYLSAWKHRASGEGVWKFNKNCQSWLIRHMYDSEKISKSFFIVLLEYLIGLKGMTKRRVKEDAVKRALRYKSWEKESGADNDKEKKDINRTESKSTEQSKSENEKERKSLEISKEQVEDIEKERWAALGDHDKRKEYKRARKVIDALKEDTV